MLERNETSELIDSVIIAISVIVILHLEPCQTRYRDIISRYRYIPILHPISGTILLIPDIGYFPISGFPTSGNTRYRESQYRVYPDIGIPDIGTFPISGFPISGMSRYRVCPDIGIPDIGKYPISGICNIVPDIGFNIGIYRYREIMSRYRVWQGSRCRDDLK